LRGVAEALEPRDGREGPSSSGKNPGGIFERVPEKTCLAPAQNYQLKCKSPCLKLDCTLNKISKTYIHIGGARSGHGGPNAALAMDGNGVAGPSTS